MSRPLRIGEFATRSGLSVRTLRFYDALGLLTPRDVDPGTRYRGYAIEQVGRAQAIAELRRFGFSLEEIARALSTQVPEERLLEQAARRLERTIALQTAQLQDLRERLKRLENGPPQVRIRSEDARWVAAVKDRVSGPGDVPELFAELRSGLGRVPAGGSGVLWHRCEHEDGPLTAEVFLEVVAGTRGKGRVDVFELPAVEVAAVRTVDDDEAAEVGYRTLRDWMREAGQVLCGPKREIPVQREGALLEVQFPFRQVS